MKCKVLGNNEVISDYFRKAGMKVGQRCNLYSNIMTAEPYLVEIGDNVTFAGDVALVTHDNSIGKLNLGGSNLFGKITIGSNCFIGQRSIIMYGVTLADNIIVSSGSVVCNSFSQSKIIIGGNPAHIIGTWDALESKNGSIALNRNQVKEK